MAMVLRAIEVGGVDHICFWDVRGSGGGLKSIEDISFYPKVTERLKAAGYSDADIEKMSTGNVLCIMDAQG
jgi:membrane dipeptidase